MKHPLSLLILLPLLSHPITAQSEQPSGGDIDFTTYSSYQSFRQCLKEIFAPYLQFGMTVPGQNVGCTTNECLCQPHNIESNIPLLYTRASKDCSNTKDAQSATVILDGYCSDAGYTEREGAVATGGTTNTKPKAAPAVTTTAEVTKTLGSGALVVETTVVVTEDTTATNNSPETSTPSSKDENNDLSVGSIVGIVVGVLGFIATTVGVYFGYKQYKNLHRATPLVTRPEQVGMMERGVVYGNGGSNPNLGYGYNDGGHNGLGWR